MYLHDSLQASWIIAKDDRYDLLLQRIENERNTAVKGRRDSSQGT